MVLKAIDRNIWIAEGSAAPAPIQQPQLSTPAAV